MFLEAFVSQVLEISAQFSHIIFFVGHSRIIFFVGQCFVQTGQQPLTTVILTPNPSATVQFNFVSAGLSELGFSLVSCLFPPSVLRPQAGQNVVEKQPFLKKQWSKNPPQRGERPLI